MSFLLDTNICSAHLKRPAGLMHRFIQHSGRLHIATIVLGELYTWAFHRKDPSWLIAKIENDLLTDVTVFDFDSDCAMRFGKVRGQLLQQGISVSRVDLMIASMALAHDLTLVTDNTKHFDQVPGLRLVNWLAP